MTWLELAALAAVLLGLCGGAVLVAQRPAFWVGLAIAAFKAALPSLKNLLKSSPETQEEHRRRVLEGRERRDR